MATDTEIQSATSTKNTNPLTRQSVIDAVQANLEGIQSFDVQSLELFGSVARNQFKPSSDLDFLVEFKKPATFRGYMGLKFFLEDLFECSVDLVSRKKLHPVIRDAVLEEAVRVA